jgi:hypothetical protein
MEVLGEVDCVDTMRVNGWGLDEFYCLVQAYSRFVYFTDNLFIKEEA